MSTVREVIGVDDQGAETTEAAHRRAVERVIRAMHEHIDEPLSLQDLADIAYMSPYHFNRVFRTVTGVPPCQFLYALRLARAKRLLATTDRSVTDICFGVGYNSLGTFSARFAELVGLSPSRLPRVIADLGGDWSQKSQNRSEAKGGPTTGGVTGRVIGPESVFGPILVGLFPDPIPQGEPVACAWLDRPGTYHVAAVPDGSYYVMAVALGEEDDTGIDFPMMESEMHVGSRSNPIHFQNGRVENNADVALRPMRLTDPPILTALPLLLLDAHSDDGGIAQL